MDNSLKHQLKRLLFILLSFFLFIAICFLIIIYMFPFILAFFVGMILHPIVTFLEVRWKLNRGVSALVVMSLFFTVSLLSGYLFIKRAFFELSELVQVFPKYIIDLNNLLHHIEDSVFTPLYAYLHRFFPELIPYNFSLAPFIIDKIKTNATELIHKGLLYTSHIVSSFAYTSIVVLFIILATYFMTKDYQKIVSVLKNIIPKKIKKMIDRLKGFAKQSTIGLIKAQLTVACFTTIISFFSFLVFQIDHTLIITSILFFIDLVPYVGIGALFIPWILYEFFTHGYTLTIQLSVLYSFLILIRQIIEPRLLAKNLGIHPLITIIILFLSIHLFGALGLLLTPISLIFLSSLYHAKIFHYILKFIQDGSLS